MRSVRRACTKHGGRVMTLRYPTFDDWEHNPAFGVLGMHERIRRARLARSITHATPPSGLVTNEEVMTARLDAARAAVFATVRMYAPVHQDFSAEASRRLTIALADLEAAAVEAAKPAAPPVPPLDPGATPEAAKFNPPTAAQPDAVGKVTAPDPVPLETPPAPPGISADGTVPDHVETVTVHHDQAPPEVAPAGKSSGKIRKPPQ